MQIEKLILVQNGGFLPGATGKLLGHARTAHEGSGTFAGATLTPPLFATEKAVGTILRMGGFLNAAVVPKIMQQECSKVSKICRPPRNPP